MTLCDESGFHYCANCGRNVSTRIVDELRLLQIERDDWMHRTERVEKELGEVRQDLIQMGDDWDADIRATQSQMRKQHEQLQELQTELANAKEEIGRLRCEEIPLLVTESANRRESLESVVKALMFEWRENHIRVCRGELLDTDAPLPSCVRGENCMWGLPEMLLVDPPPTPRRRVNHGQ